MRRIVFVVLSVLLLAPAAILAFNTPRPPKIIEGVETSLDKVDFSSLPPKSYFRARDHSLLSFRFYGGDPSRTLVLIHGSSGSSAGMHALAHFLQGRGFSVYALSMRGHDGLGRSGDIDYVGQLDDDLADFVATLPPMSSGRRRGLLGFSSGGGFVSRIAGGPYAKMFDQFILVAPALPHDAPTSRANTGGWAGVAVPRIVVLSLMDSLGIHGFDSLKVLAFGVPPDKQQIQTAFYSYRMMSNFAATKGFQSDLARAPGPVAILDGADDELMVADAYAGTLKPARPDIKIEILPGLRHMDMIVNPVALQAIADVASH